MSYDYIHRRYAIYVPVGAFVQHTVTGRVGVVMPENVSHGHYVQVQFQGDNFQSNCHPEELDYDVAEVAA